MSDQSASPSYGGLTPTWTVTDVTETTAQDNTGRFAKGKQVTFQLASGQVGTVFLPDASFTPDTVKAAIRTAAANLHAVVNLNSAS